MLLTLKNKVHRWKEIFFLQFVQTTCLFTVPTVLYTQTIHPEQQQVLWISPPRSGLELWNKQDGSVRLIKIVAFILQIKTDLR